MPPLRGLSLALATLLVVGFCGASPHLLGQKKCTYGPSYWCENIPQAKECKAFSHCKQTVWEQHVYPRDNDEICKICLDMVTQARDQLRSNETLEDLKAVFEGSCALIPIKLVRKECDKLVDDFIPELVEALSSEMDPTAVCSVAGLCNNKKIDQLLLDYYQTAPAMPYGAGNAEYESLYGNFNCDDCGRIGSIIATKFRRAHPDDVLEGMIRGCGQLGSFSDACATLAIVHFQDVYAALKQRLTSDNLCHLSGACYLKYHKHDEGEKEGGLEVRPMGNVGLIRQQQGDQEEVVEEGDVPCDLCKQLVVHLRDIVVANSTEEEFRQVLDGICDELGSLRAECRNVVQQYSKAIFDALNASLNPDLVCQMINICPGEGARRGGLLMPLVALEPARIQISLRKLEKGAELTREEVDAFQLPFDTLMGPQNADQLVENGQVCTLCEMVLHFVQQTLAQPATEQEIKEALEGTCRALPQSIRAECTGFVDTYGDAVMAMLIQEIDPSAVCPRLRMCSQRVKEDVEIFETKPVMNVEIQSTEKPTCPLCLFAVTEAQQRIQSDKSVQNIRHTLETLCRHLPQKLNVECTDFVDSYAQTLVNLLVKDLTPQQICVQLKLCTEQKDKAVPDFKAIDAEEAAGPECIVCEHMVKELEKELKDPTDRAEIKRILDHACDKVKENLKQKCDAFMEKHEEQIIQLVVKGANPKEMCTALGFCDAGEPVDKEIFVPFARDDDILNNEIPDDTYNGRVVVMGHVKPKSLPQCELCKHLMKELEKQLVNKRTRDQIKEALERVCFAVKKELRHKCTNFMDKHAEQIIDLLLKGMAPGEVCAALGFCGFVSEREMLEDVVDKAFNGADIDENFSIDFISIPAGPSSVGRISLMNQEPQQQQVEVENRQPPKVRANEGCVLCEFIMTKLEQDLNNKSTQDEIRKAVENVCTVLPKNVRGPCTKFVDNYAELVISLLATMPPAKICEELKMCTPPKDTEQVVQAVSNDVLECAVCQGAVTILDRLLEDEKFDRDLEQVVERTCGIAPKLYKKKCAELVRSYGPSMINMLLANMQPEKVCEEIQLCFPNEYSAFVQINDEVIPSRIRRDTLPLIGSNECTWGPGFWCASLANAQKCNSMDHCLKTVWKGQQPSA